MGQMTLGCFSKTHQVWIPWQPLEFLYTDVDHHICQLIGIYFDIFKTSVFIKRTVT